MRLISSNDLDKLHLTRDHFRLALAINSVFAEMAMDGRVIMTAADAQRVSHIAETLKLAQSDVEPQAEGQVAAGIQPASHPQLLDIEDRMRKLGLEAVA